MLKRYLMVLAALLALPTFANAWYVNAKTSSTSQGSITPSGTKSYATGVNSDEYAVAPIAGYKISKVTLDGVALEANGNGKYVAPYLATKSYRYLVASFAKNSVNINVSAGAGGAVYEDTYESLTNIPVGSVRQIVIAPNAGYSIAAFSAVNATVTDNPNGSKTAVFTDLQANQSVSATFALAPVVTAYAGSDVSTTGNTADRAATLYGSATSNQGAVTYAWTGAGLVFGTPAAATTTVYSATPGSYTATLTVTSNGITVTDTAAVNVVSSIAYDNNQCTSCHNNSTPLVVAAYNAGSHGTSVISCQACHNNGHLAPKASVSVPPVTADAVDAGDSYLPAPAEFAGSNSCLPCHAGKFEGWSKSLHNKPTKYLANQGEGILVNDAVGTLPGNDFVEGLNFNRADFQTAYGYANPFATQAAAGVAPIMKKVGSDYIIQIGSTEYKINRTQGGNGYWKQRYYTEVGGGNYVLPIQFNEVSKRYSAYNPQYWYVTATPTVPRFSQAYGSAELLAAFKTASAAGGDGPASSSWENRCAGCHQSGLTVKLIEGEVVSGYADINVGCEACHGPAAAHAAAPTKANIVNPNDYLSQVGGAFKAVETCGKCHQRGESQVYIGAGGIKAAAGTAGSIQKKIEAPAKLSADLSTAIFFPLGDDLFGGGWYTDNVGIFGAKGSMTYNGVAGFPTYAASNQHHQQWEDLEQGKHGANFAETTPGATKMACWSCHDLHSPKGSHNTKSKMTVSGITLTGLSADNNTLCLACHAGKGKFAALTVAGLQADPTGADVVAAVNAHVSARIPGKTITAANYLAAGRKNGGSSTYGLITYKNGQCVSCHMPLTPSSSGLRIYTDALGKGQGDQHSHTMKTILAPVGTAVTSCSGCHGDFTDFVAEKLAPKTVEAGQAAPGVSAAAGFVGANSCKSCHLEQFAGYTDTFHNKPLKTIAVLTDSVIKNDSDSNGLNDFKDGLDFNVAPLSVFQGGTANPWANMTAAGNAPRLSYTGGKYYITIGAVSYEIIRTQGGNGKWKQRFHTKIGEGYYVLPVQFNEISRQYEAYNNTNWYRPNNTPWINAGSSNSDPAVLAQVSNLLTTAGLKAEYPGFAGTGNQGTSTSSWDNRCSACHQTGAAIEYKNINGTMQVVSSSSDLNIGCESCHGGGANHLKNPYAADSIINPAKFTNKFRANEVCGQCHSRTEGFAHFSSASGRVYAGVEAPSKIVDGSDETKAESYILGQSLLDYIEKVIPNAWKANGTSGNSGLTAVPYDGATGKFVNGVAASGHHQQWHDLDSGPHGAASGITCFSCHDPHKSNSGNIKTSAKVDGVTVATKSTDNSLCLSCHAGNGVFATVSAADVAGIAAEPKVEAVMEAVYTHLVERAGYPADEAKKASWKSRYLSSVQADGTTSATFGIAVYKVGQCISCHMPFSAKSGIYTADAKNPTRKQGDQRAHTMKTLWPGTTGLTAATGLTGTASITSCSACHQVSL